MVTGVPHLRQSKFENGSSPRGLLFSLGGVLGQGGYHASQREQALRGVRGVVPSI